MLHKIGHDISLNEVFFTKSLSAYESSGLIYIWLCSTKRQKDVMVILSTGIGSSYAETKS